MTSSPYRACRAGAAHPKTVRLFPRPLAVALATILAGSSEAATITVDTASDGSVAGHCSLRDAVVAANTDAAVAGCTAGNGANTIEFASGVVDIVLSGAAGGELVVRKELALDGRDQMVTVRRNAADTPFRIINVPLIVNAPARVPLHLRRITISGGKAITNIGGGGIYDWGDLTLIDCVVSGNSATGESGRGGGIYAYQALLTNSTVSGNSTQGRFDGGGGIRANAVLLTNSQVSGNSTAGLYGRGGGIYASFAATLTGSTVSCNSTLGNRADGGGIRSGSTLYLTDSVVSGNSTGYLGGGATAFTATLLRSTVSGNRANVAGGGLNVEVAYLRDSSVADNSANGSGAGLVALSSVELVSSTVSGNRSVNGDGGGIDGYQAVLIDSTVSGNSTQGVNTNGGGILASELSLDNSTVADNTAAGTTALGNGIMILGGFVLTLNSSLVSGNHGAGADIGSNVAITMSGNHNLVGTTNANIVLPPDTLHCDPRLEPLADNGGSTLTHAVGAGSCAINAGSNIRALAFDQRGKPFARVSGAAADIGAFELQVGDAIFRDGFDGN